ncbi:MAG: hypothetical protein M1827_006249 [Pycnora praestabilis]|nr:MAG: hypothetical protein M1827_006249 [Pycnora praestabilis]
MTSNPLKIAIVGAGPGGLLLARVLHQNQIPYTIFEAETSPNTRPQGGTLDLHPPTGQRAIKEAGLWSDFEKVARPDGEEMKLGDSAGKIYIHEQSQGNCAPEVDRNALRILLRESIPEDSIRWGYKVQKVEVSEGGEGTIHFAHGNTESGFDLIVGADGAWSKIRPLLSSAVPYYSGITGPDMNIPNVDIAHPVLSRLVGKGTYFTLTDNKSIVAQRCGDGSIRVYPWHREAEDWNTSSGIDWKSPVDVRAKLLKIYEGWVPELKALIEATDDNIVPRNLYMLPIGHCWAHVPGLTLLGDAAHVMTPFAGEGVNLALLDGLELGLAIASVSKVRNTFSSSSAEATQDIHADIPISPTTIITNATFTTTSNSLPTTIDSDPGSKSLSTAIRTFEKAMFARATEVQQEAWDNMQMMYCDTAPKQMAARFQEYADTGVFDDGVALRESDQGMRTR